MLEDLLARAQAAPKRLWGVHVGEQFVDERIYLEWGPLFTKVDQYSIDVAVEWDRWIAPAIGGALKRRAHNKHVRRVIARVGQAWQWHVYEEPVEAEVREWFSSHAAELLELCADAEAVVDAAWKSARIVPTGKRAWHHERQSSWTVRGEVRTEVEEAFIARLIEFGVTVTPNRMDAPVPAHRHRAGRQFTNGKALTVEFDGGQLSYVPHGSVSTEFVPINRWTARLTPERWREACEAFAISVYHINDLRSLPSGRVIPATEVRGTDRFHSPTRAALAKAGYIPHDGGWAYRGDVRLVEAIDKLGNWTPSEALDVSWTTDKTGESGLRQAISWQLSRAASKAGWPKAARGVLATCEPDVEHEWSSTRRQVPHKGPYSERGTLRIRHADPAVALGLLHERGLIEHVALVDGDDPEQQHRPLLMLEEYRTAETALPRLPKNKMIIHGLTGAANHDEMLERLELIVASGGLKSLAERRRLGLTLSSLDQHGDTASSMDLGVPATITSSPWAGGNIFFVLHPRLMGRRDMWMMNGCPGGTGRDQRNAYSQYAKQLGHKLGQPPSHAARVKHLKTGLTQYNEVYFKYEVPLRDIVALMVTTKHGLSDRVTKRVERWQAEGLVDFTVVPFSDSGHASNSGILPGPNQSVGLQNGIAGLWAEYAKKPQVVSA